MWAEVSNSFGDIGVEVSQSFGTPQQNLRIGEHVGYVPQIPAWKQQNRAFLQVFSDLFDAKSQYAPL